jgi:D-arabinose 1-dehydrogenase-like Zn-dependent alcohol dehydrogenase
MTTMRAMQISRPGGEFEQVQRPVPKPATGQVRVRVQACGVCHSDVFAKENSMGATPYPIVPGHEIAGVIDELGPGVAGSWRAGDRVGVGWFGGACHHCAPCRDGDLINCVNSGIPGITFDGGYADQVVIPADALAAVPEGLSPVEVAPLMCAGVTVYDALRKSPARPGDRVAVVGLGGLGHLGVQFAANMGFEVVAVSRGTEKQDLAHKLGAAAHIDATAADPGQALAEMGGATVVLCTAPSGEAATRALPGLAPRGQLIVVGIGADSLQVAPFSLIGGATSVAGHPSGTAADSEATLRFARISDSRAMVETLPLEQAGEAYQKMISGDQRFRMVLTT